MHEESLNWYLFDSIAILKEWAIAAKKHADNPKEDYEAYNKGWLDAYYHLFSTLKRLADVFGINQEDIKLADIDPDVDLVLAHGRTGLGADIQWLLSRLKQWGPRHSNMLNAEAAKIIGNEKYRGYIIASIGLLKERARAIKKDEDNQGRSGDGYIGGQLMGYCAIFSLLKHEALVFEIDWKEIDLADIKPEADLLGLRMNPDIDPGPFYTG